MNRDSGHRQIIIAGGVHAHHREHAANVEQLLRRAESDSTVSLDPNLSISPLCSSLARIRGSRRSVSALTSSTSSRRVPY